MKAVGVKAYGFVIIISPGRFFILIQAFYFFQSFGRNP